MLQQHCSIAEEVGDLTGQRKACGNLGVCYFSLGQYVEAIEMHEKAWAIAEEVGDQAGQGKACGNLGVCYDSLGQYDKDNEMNEKSWAIAEESDRGRARREFCRSCWGRAAQVNCGGGE